MFSKIRIFRRMHLGFSETSSSVFTSPPWQLSNAKLLNTACLRTAWSIPVPLTGLVGRLAVCILIYKFAYTKLAYSTVQQYSTVQYRRGKREEGEEPVSKHQIRPGDGRWTGRRGVGRLNPRRENKIQGKNGDGEGRKLKKSQGETSWKILARKRRRRGRAERRRLQQSKRRNRARARGREIAVATHNVRTMAVDGTHGVGRALDVLSVYDRLGCDIIGLQETRRSGQAAFSQAGYLVYCSGECGGENDGKKGQGGVGLAVRNSITRAARPPEFISDRLLKVTLELRGRAKAVTFVVAYAPTEPQNANNTFWTSLDRVSCGRGT